MPLWCPNVGQLGSSGIFKQTCLALPHVQCDLAGQIHRMDEFARHQGPSNVQSRQEQHVGRRLEPSPRHSANRVVSRHSVFEEICLVFGRLMVDLSTMLMNKKLQIYCSTVLDPLV